MRDLLALATALNATLIMPPLVCTCDRYCLTPALTLTLTLTLTVTVTVTLTLTRCDRYWGNTQNCRMPTAPQDMPLPFRCSQDALFEVTLVGVRVLGLGLGLGLANPNPNPLQGQAVEP